ncbi:phage tail protein [Nocardioides sp.]|uniref:phage tail protein n=1 Tax=Nocardioides sp. TaxID=35761 RepID=UPI0027365D0C|nr:phage tail protein [Nocardioides sp.]MDP3892564.1 phage tail protein [Nocardioides sp.]
MTMTENQTPLGGDLPIANRFLFELDGVEIGVFREVHGLEVTVAVEELREGGQNGFSHRLPGRMTWPPLVFRRGVTQSNELFEWLARTSGEGFAGNENKLDRCTGAVTAIDHVGTRLRSWEFIDVFPVRWKGPDFTVGSTDPLEEELEVTHHGFRARTQSG